MTLLAIPNNGEPIPNMGESRSHAGPSAPASALSPATETPPPATSLGEEVDLIKVVAAPATPIPWAIRGLIAEQDIALVSGEGGIGKSYVLMQMAIDLALGKAAFELLPVARRYNILYLDQEMSKWETEFRFRRMLLGNGVTPETVPTNLKVMAKSNFQFDKHLSDINRYIEEYKIDFVLIDSIRRTTGSNINDSGTTNALFSYLKILRSKYGCGGIFLAHQRKPSISDDTSANDPKYMLMGSADWRNMSDCHVAVTYNQKEDHISIEPDKSRHEEALSKFDLQFQHIDRDDDAGPFKVVFVDDDATHPIRSAVLACLREKSDLTFKEINTKLGVTRKVLRKAVEELEARSKIVAARTGGFHGANLYRLSPLAHVGPRLPFEGGPSSLASVAPLATNTNTRANGTAVTPESEEGQQ